MTDQAEVPNDPQQVDLSKAKKVFESRGLNGQEELVERIKFEAECLYTAMEAVPVPNPESARLMALAKTSVEEAVMWAVKSVSRNHTNTAK
jgi:hypothetical protein